MMETTSIIDFTYIAGSFFYILGYVKVTVFITLISVVMGAILGLLSCVVQQNNVPVLRVIARIYVLVCRSLPNMVLLYLVYYGLPILFLAMGDTWGIHIPFQHVSALLVACIGLTLHTGAYLSEIFRAALQSVPTGQWEATQAMGMTWLQGFRRVVLPQAVVFALPLFANQFLSTMKSTSICFVITVVEIFGAAKLFCEDNSQYFEAYIVAACFYWGMGIFFEFVFSKLEYTMGKFKRGNA
jgi:polar amino acid transport system permease protein/L-cystine transport system permease protein